MAFGKTKYKVVFHKEKSLKFLKDLEEQRYDDHRLYHHSRMNQVFHLYSALSFIASYILLFINPVIAAFVGWHGMIPRQIGHFFCEPRDFDKANNMSHEEKESIKVGYNLTRKRYLLSALGLIPLFSGVVYFAEYITISQAIEVAGYLMGLLAIIAVVGRSIYLTVVREDKMVGIVWFSKIMTDPFNDIKLYWKSPWQCLKGDWYDPGTTTYPMRRYWVDKLKRRDHDEERIITT